MLPSHSKPLRLVPLIALALTALTTSGVGPQQNPTQGPKQSPFDVSAYFPPDRNDTGIFPYVLYDLKEPSFLDRAHTALFTAHMILLDALELQREFFKIKELEPIMQTCIAEYAEMWKGDAKID
jgi:hypothetical protein